MLQTDTGAVKLLRVADSCGMSGLSALVITEGVSRGGREMPRLLAGLCLAVVADQLGTTPAALESRLWHVRGAAIGLLRLRGGSFDHSLWKLAATRARA